MSSKLNQLNRRGSELRGRRLNHIQITDSSKKADATEVHTRGSADNKHSTRTDDGESSEDIRPPRRRGGQQAKGAGIITNEDGSVSPILLVALYR